MTGSTSAGTEALVVDQSASAARPRKSAVLQLPKREMDARDRVRVAVRRSARPLCVS